MPSDKASPASGCPPTSSPLSEAPPSQRTTDQSHGSQKPVSFRPACALPFELAQHVHVYLEESLFTQAFNFLTSLLSSSASSQSWSAPAVIPSPVHLAIAATLCVHPSFTTRTTVPEKWEQSNAALRLLRLTHKAVGPVNADFSRAFEFKRFDSRASRSGRGREGADEEAGEEIDVKIDSPFADSASLWTRAEDFWNVVGWAFSCSCLQQQQTMYKARWERWALWLELMLDILETDWRVRFPDKCEESLLWQFIETATGGHGRNRRMMRAIFADGSAKSLNEFKEVFRNELKEPKKEADKPKKREVNVNVEAEVYGDYMVDDDSDEDSDESTTAKRARTRTPSSRRITPRSSAGTMRSDYSAADDNDNHPTATARSPPLLGGIQSIQLRLRLLHLLPPVATVLPGDFLDVGELYPLFAEFIKPLPLSTFQLLISPSVFPASRSAVDFQVTLVEYVLQTMRENTAPRTRNGTCLTQQMLEVLYLPFAASKADVVSNAKVSLMCESLLRNLKRTGGLRKTEALIAAVGRGIENRKQKAAVGVGVGERRAKKPEADTGQAWDWLVESGDRMRDVVNAAP